MIMVAGSVLIFNSCTKQGAQGPRGYTGADGNANVKGAQAFSVTHWDLSNNVYSATFTDVDITTDIADNGVVEVYMQYADGSWTNLPDINAGISTVYNFYPGGFYISVLSVDGTTTPFPGTQTFRTVIISSSLRQAHPNTNWKNYKEAMSAINETTAASTPAATN